MKRMKLWLRKGLRVATCHHCLYGAMAVIYGAQWALVLDKALVAPSAMAVYLLLALRG